MIGFIYKLECIMPSVDEVYVGSTQNMTVRKGRHKSSCNNSNGRDYNLNVYQYIRVNGGFENWRMVEIERVEYERKPELLAREQFHLKNLNASLNTQIPGRTNVEYYQDNRDAILTQKQQHYQQNRERLTEYQQQYRVANREIITEYRVANRERMNEYYQRKKDAHAVKNNCPCGGKYTGCHKNRHSKTARHITFVASTAVEQVASVP